MSAADGSVLGLTKILDNGSQNERFNIVIVSEGFRDTAGDQADFDDRCQQIVDAFQNEQWFGEGLLAAINIYRLNVSSTDAGADNPASCGDGTNATAVEAATYFDATYCTDGVRRCLGADWDLLRDTVTAEIDTWHAIVLLVNSTDTGGCASGNVFAAALDDDWLETVMHELGHAAFNLADEYSYRAGCSIDTDYDQAPAGEPAEPNITAASSLAGLKWSHLVGPITPVPTMQNPDCSNCDLRQNVRPSDLEIGLYEGAGYYHCGYYRPAYTCRMKSSTEPFCRVCVDAIHTRLRPFFQDTPTLAASLSELDFGNVGAGSTMSLPIEVSNVGNVNVTGIDASIASPNFAVAPLAIGTLAPGESQILTITFGPVNMNGPRTGTLLVTSDNADTLNIDLRASVCTPWAWMDVVTADGSLTLNFGDVARRLTMYRWFEVRNRKTLCPSQLSVTLSAAPAGFDYAPGTSLTFTLPAPTAEQQFTARRVYAAFPSPEVGGPDFSGEITITTPDDTAASPTMLGLVARAIDPPPVDSVLVIDRSGSMSEPTGVPGASKMDLAIQASTLYISLLKDNDRIGVVRFNNEAVNPDDVLQTLVVAGDPDGGAGRAAAIAVLTPGNLSPSGNTSIGGGTILGSEILEGADATARAVVVLTDGIQNTAPDIPEATETVAGKSPRQRVFAVGLGLNQLEDTLVQLASVTNGVAQITGDLVGDREFLLQKLYVQILSDVGDEAFVQDPTEVLFPGMQRATDVLIGEVDVAADFIVSYRRATAHPYIELWLEAPNGTIIRPGDAGGTFPNVLFVGGSGHVYFRVQFPTFPARPRAHIGRWRVWLASRRGTGALTHGSGTAGGNTPFFYAVMSKARSNLRLAGSVVQATYAPGSTMTVLLESTLYGQPVKLDLPVEVRVTRPDGVVRTIELAETAYGQYRGVFDDTWQLGPYPIAAAVSATTPGGYRVTRYRHMTGLIFRPGRGPQDGGGDGSGTGDRECREARAMLARLARLLGRCSGCDPKLRDEAQLLLRWLRGFIADCCRKRPAVAAGAMHQALEQARRVVAALESVDDDPAS